MKNSTVSKILMAVAVCMLITGGISVANGWEVHFNDWGIGERGSGNVKSETRQLGDFHSIEANGFMDVYVTQGESGPVRIEGDDNLLDNITTEVRGGVLVIGTTEGSITTNNDMKIYVSMRDIRKLAVAGSGSIQGQNDFKTGDIGLEIEGSGDIKVAGTFKKLKSEISGSGDIAVKGTATSQSVEVNGSGDVHAEELQTIGDCHVEISGSGDCRVWANGILKAEINGSGDVRYKGTPTSVDSDISGSGSVSRLK
ncbi:MAG TPA: head GIN domain-containing protein [Patescibacteria group bacterium]|nr:head GIN domain-containing protein [Patescibacteria group bacterium]